MSCDSYQPTNLESVLPLSYTNVILYLYVVCLGIDDDDIQGPKGLGTYTGQVQKVNDPSSETTTTTQDPKIQEEIHRWTAWFILVLNSAVMRVLSLALFQSVFSIVKKVALKCKDIPSHSRLRMNSSKIWITSYAIYSAFSQVKSSWMLTTNTKDKISQHD